MDLLQKIKEITEAKDYNIGMYFTCKSEKDRAIYAATAKEFLKQRKRFVTIYEKDTIQKAQLKLL